MNRGCDTFSILADHFEVFTFVDRGFLENGAVFLGSVHNENGYSDNEQPFSTT